MASDNARILVIGAGVNGSVCAGRLFERGVDVTVLARGKRDVDFGTYHHSTPEESKYIRECAEKAFSKVPCCGVCLSVMLQYTDNTSFTR
jgi:ketopantoate reductase